MKETGAGRRPGMAALGAVGLALCLQAPCAVAGFGVPELVRILESHGMGGAITGAVDGALTGLIRSIDPEARLCSAEEAARLRAGAAAGGTVSNAGVVAVFESWPEGLAYLKVRGLESGGGVEILGHLRALTGGNGVILDLRGTDGADLDSVVTLASPFYRAGVPLFRVENLSGETLDTKVAADEAPLGCPLMALIDRDTRCAAETLAALWRGRAGVMLIGEATRGDARLRELLPLPDGRYAHMATRRLAPAGGAYETNGVRPDVAVEAVSGGPTPLVHVPGYGRPLSEKSKADRDLMMRVDGDPVLRRGTDILLALRALHEHGR